MSLKNIVPKIGGVYIEKEEKKEVIVVEICLMCYEMEEVEALTNGVIFVDKEGYNVSKEVFSVELFNKKFSKEEK